MSIQIIIEFIVALAVMIILHELGHFIACRIFKVEVEEFGLGFPPRAVKLFTAGGTLFSLNWLPLGGFVRPKGENDPSVPGGLAAANPWVRIAVFAAGPLMNLLTAFLLYTAIVSIIGKPDPARLDVIQVTLVSPQSPAEQAGLLPGDIILSINDESIHSIDVAHDVIYSNLGVPVRLAYQRGDSVVEVTLTPRNPPPDDGAVGIIMDTPRLSVNYFQALPDGVLSTFRYAQNLLGMIGGLIRGSVPAEQGRLVGLKGMYDIYQTVRTSEPSSTIPGIVDVLGFFTSITISLGLLNLLPIPALDGGRIVFALPEIVIRKRIPPEYENWVNGISFLILIALMLLINLQDFINPAQIP